jgi:hypothetical protein
MILKKSIIFLKIKIIMLTTILVVNNASQEIYKKIIPPFLKIKPIDIARGIYNHKWKTLTGIIALDIFSDVFKTRGQEKLLDLLLPKKFTMRLPWRRMVKHISNLEKNASTQSNHTTEIKPAN